MKGWTEEEIRNKDLMARARDLIAANREAVVGLLAGNAVEWRRADEIIHFLKDFGAASPPGLRRLADRVAQEVCEMKKGSDFLAGDGARIRDVERAPITAPKW